jgi:hypothetical protein
VNVEDPALPIQLASMGKVEIVPVGFKLVLIDHDFHVVNLTREPLLAKIKANLDGNGELKSFYKGIFVLSRVLNLFLM